MGKGRSKGRGDGRVARADSGRECVGSRKGEEEERGRAGG